jgi:hypothetical protein
MTAPRGAASRLALCVLAAAGCALAAGCGLGPGEDAGEVELTVTRDYGRQELIRGTEEVAEFDTVLRALDRLAEVETRFGGGFVQSIDGISGGSEEGRRHDWFFYVNGIESPLGAAEYELGGGDRVWWDHRDWTAAMRVPAVVGSYPEPFLHGFNGSRWTVQVVCAARDACSSVIGKLEGAGVEVEAEAVRDAGAGEGRARLLVGPWRLIRSDRTARLLETGPDRSGVFASFSREGDTSLLLLDERGGRARSVGPGAGLVAALRPDQGPPTWVVTGTDAVGVVAAARALGAGLRNRYAVAITPQDGAIGLPLIGGGIG